MPKVMEFFAHNSAIGEKKRTLFVSPLNEHSSLYHVIILRLIIICDNILLSIKNIK